MSVTKHGIRKYLALGLVLVLLLSWPYGPEAAANPVNVLNNAGFENGTTGWDVGDSGFSITSSTGEVHGGAQAGKLSGSGSPHYISQTLTVDLAADAEYELSAYGFRGTGSLGWAMIAVELKDAAGQYVGGYVGGANNDQYAAMQNWQSAADQSGYAYRSETFVAPAGTASMKVIVYVDAEADFYVDDIALSGPPIGDPGGEYNPNPTSYYVSADSGSDSNPGTLAAPFQTIQQAADTAKSGDTIYIRGGTYEETVTPAGSGTSAQPIRYQAYNDEDVTISGAETISSSWQLYSGNIYKTNVELGLGTKNAVFVEHEMMMPARWPNASEWLERSTALVDNPNSTPTQLHPRTDEGPALPNLDWTGAKVWVYTNWIGWTSPILSVDNGIIGLNDNAPDAWTQLGYQANPWPVRYYIYDSLAALDTADEWYYDESAHDLYLYAPGGVNPGQLTVQYKARETALNLNNRSWLEFEGIEIQGATIRGTHMNHVKFDKMKIVDYGFDSDSDQQYGSQLNIGLILQGDGIEIRNSEIANSSGYGINVRGDDSVLFNNYIHDVGYAGAITTGIEIAGRNGYIGHNTVERTGGGCINGNTVFQSLIEFNDFGYCGMISYDNGTMHWAKNDYQNTEIRYNYFHDGQDGASYIYLDNGSSNMIIHHNSVYNTQLGGVNAVSFNQPSNYVLFYDNMINGGVSSVYGPSFQDDTYKLSIYDNVITGNIEITGPADIHDNSSAGFSVITDGGAPGHNFTNPLAEPAPLLSFSDPAGRNLVNNAGFEGMIDKLTVPNDLRDWTKTGLMNAAGQLAVGDPIGQSEGFTRTGNGSVRLSGTSADGIEQTISGLLPGKWYEFSSWTKVDAGEEASVGVKDFADDANMSETIGDTQQGWVRKTQYFQVGASSTSATIYLAKASTGAGYVYGDDFGLVYVGDSLPPPPPPKAGENILLNGSFEEDEASWDDLVNTDIVTTELEVSSGAKAMQIQSGSQGGGMQQVSAGVMADAEYILSAWARVGSAGTAGRLQISAKDANGNLVGTAPIAYIDWTETAFARKSVKFTVPANAAALEVRFLKESGTAVFELDDIALREAVNLIPNAGFEKSDQALYYLAATNFQVISDANAAHSGTRFVNITNDAPTGYGYAHTFITDGIAENTTYTFSMWGRRGMSGTVSGAFVALANQADKEVLIPECASLPANQQDSCQQAGLMTWSDTAWTQKSFTFTTKPGTHVIKMIFWEPEGEADFSIDDLSLVEEADTTVPADPGPAAGNLVVNPGFESSPPDGWDYLVTTTNGPDVYAGTTAARIAANSGMVQTITAGATGNTAYTISGWGKRGAGSGAGFLMVQCKDANGQYFSPNYQTVLNWTGTTYTLQSDTFTTPAGTASIVLNVWVNSGAADLYLDDIALTENEG